MILNLKYLVDYHALNQSSVKHSGFRLEIYWICSLHSLLI